MQTPHNPMNENQLYEQFLQEQGRMNSMFQTDSDFLVDQIMDNIEASPLGRLLKVIATLPEVRYEKVERARRHVHQADECLDEQMDAALDRVLEELIAEG